MVIYGNHAIRKVVIATGVVTTFAGAGFNPGSADGTGPAARFRSPMGLTWDGAGALYVADTGNHTIRKVGIATGEVTTLAGVAHIEGHADGSGRSARFRQPSGVAADGAGHLYVADTGNHAIRRVVSATWPGSSSMRAAPMAPGRPQASTAPRTWVWTAQATSTSRMLATTPFARCPPPPAAYRR
jgi:sugar lactone lactonase YvrE